MASSRNRTPTSGMEFIKAQYKTLRPANERFLGNELFLIRCGEKISEVFPDWVERSNLSEKYYEPFDLNVPVTIPRRSDMRNASRADPPISTIGKLTSNMVARELSDRRAFPIRHIYTAPTLACLQTAGEIQSYLPNKCGEIRIDWRLVVSSVGQEFWLDSEQRKFFNYRFDENYSFEKEFADNMEEYSKDLKTMMKKIAAEKGTVVVVADSLPIKIMSDFGNGIYHRQIDEDFEKATARAEEAIPPICCSAINAFHDKNNKVFFEPSPIRMRPITAIGMDSSQNKDIGFPHN